MDPSEGVFPYGNIAFKMVQELARQGRLLNNPFDDANKQLVVQEINALFQRTAMQMEALKNLPATDVMKPYIQGELLVQHMSILRNKQCMLAYLMGRVQLLQSLRWELSTESIPDEVMECLSPQEKQFREDYNVILRTYMKSVNLDLTLNLHETPSNLDIEVLVLQDYGTITTEDGNVTLKKNTTVVMRRDLAEPLIKTGVLKHVNDGS